MMRQLVSLAGRVAWGRSAGCYDETAWPMLERGSKKWWAWAMGRPDAVYYHVRKSRSHEAAGKLLGDYFGVVLTDGYAAYGTLRKAIAKANGGRTYTAAACWAHVRRKLVDCEANYPQATEAVELIGQLFTIEREVDDADFERPQERVQERARRRDQDSRAVLAKLQEWRLEQSYLPKSSFGRAVNYMDELGPKLTVFLDDPLVPLSNNLVYAARGINKIMPRPGLCRLLMTSGCIQSSWQGKIRHCRGPRRKALGPLPGLWRTDFWPVDVRALAGLASAGPRPHERGGPHQPRRGLPKRARGEPPTAH